MSSFLFYAKTINGRKKFLNESGSVEKSYTLKNTYLDATIYRTADPVSLLPLKQRISKATGLETNIQLMTSFSSGNEKIYFGDKTIYLTKVI